MTSDVQSTRLATSGVVFGGPARIKSVWVAGGANAGTLTLRNGGAAGTVVAVIDVPAGAGYDISIPGEGLRCSLSVYATVSSFTAVTVFYA